MNEFNEHVKVVDSYPGSGKTSWAINYINSLPEDTKILYITPFLDECKRVQNSTNRKFCQPETRLGNGRKRNHFLSLIRKEENIASTHALFSDIDDEIISSLRAANYILILDEAFQVLDKFNMWGDSDLPYKTSEEMRDNLTRTNIQTLISKEFIKINDDYSLEWIDNEHPIDKYKNLKALVDRGLMFFIHDSILLWSFPYEIFMPDIFNEVYILTYLFDYQMQRYYYDYFNIQYSKHHIETINDAYTLTPTQNNQHDIEWRKRIKSLIEIVDNPKLNRIGDLFYDARNKSYESALSKTWYDNNQPQIEKVRNNIINYFVNITKSKSSDRMWTCFSADKKKFKNKTLSVNDQKYWVALNSRSTNNFGYKSVLAYPINRYIDPFYNAFFYTKNISMSSDGFAISEFIQWIWRSRIRNDEPIQIYIPSCRMRRLLKEFLDNQPIL